MDGFKKMHQPSRAVGMPILQQNLPIPDTAGDAPKGKGGRPLIWIIASRDPAD